MTVLQSPELQSLLNQEDGIGNLIGVKYISSGRATFGPALYEINFKDYYARQTCKVGGNVNIQTKSLMSLSSATCIEQ